MAQNNVSLAALQHPHFNEQAKINRVRSILQMRSLHLESVADGRGGVALVYSDHWSILKFHSLEPSLGVFRLQHGDASKGVFCVSHYHHDPVVRCRRWNDLGMISCFVFPFSLHAFRSSC